MHHSTKLYQLAMQLLFTIKIDMPWHCRMASSVFKSVFATSEWRCLSSKAWPWFLRSKGFSVLQTNWEIWSVNVFIAVLKGQVIVGEKDILLLCLWSKRLVAAWPSDTSISDIMDAFVTSSRNSTPWTISVVKKWQIVDESPGGKQQSMITVWQMCSKEDGRKKSQLVAQGWLSISMWWQYPWPFSCLALPAFQCLWSVQ